ncbi:helix-turn-helix transcriptional regulator [Paraburkholderia gardini]|uniref:helix-turn-helix transcriptional regulator n=1 Tax=Paraburkholderia gardini TaxID=2823469 RepID=UPI001D449F93|nr:hypothetical protein [Paraburkholderia gardini]CAG4924722.1 hypothetical protein R69919_05234 [Paraburkholderia gardini]
MAINISPDAVKVTRESLRTAPPAINLTLPGRLRADDVTAVLRIGKTWLYKGIKDGLYPKPDFYEGKLPFWKHSTILKFLEGESAE